MIFKEHTGLQNLYTMVRYCINSTKCRRYLIARHFDEIWKEDDCQKMCDVCQRGFSNTQEDVTKLCQGFLEVLENKLTPNKRLTALKLIELWKTSSVAKEFITTKPTTVKLEKILVHCLLENILKEDLHFTPYNTISYIVPGPKAFGVRNNKFTVTMEMVIKGSGAPFCLYPTSTLGDVAGTSSTNSTTHMSYDTQCTIEGKHTKFLRNIIIFKVCNN